MGILNVTPDSFSDGGQYTDAQVAYKHALQLVEDGADIIDIGGESTRPGSEPVSTEVELQRVIPVIELLRKNNPNLILSIDTTKYEVAEQALELGVHILNDVSGLEKEPRFAQLCEVYGAAYILMHSQGDPQTMQENPEYDDIIDDLTQFFESKIKTLNEAGVHNIIIDPGIGFGKTLDHNLKMLAHLAIFRKFGYPLMIGASRKSMIGNILGGREVEGRLAGTIAVHYDTLINGVKILRVHDVKEATDSIQIFNAIQAHK